jgi:hypothetical protein
MKRRKEFKNTHIDNSSLTSILIHTPDSSPTSNNNFYLPVPNVPSNKRNKGGKRVRKVLKKFSHSQFQDAEEQIEEVNKTLLNPSKEDTNTNLDNNLNVKDVKNTKNVKNDIL